jgi:hypothetical protein
MSTALKTESSSPESKTGDTSLFPDGGTGGKPPGTAALTPGAEGVKPDGKDGAKPGEAAPVVAPKPEKDEDAKFAKKLHGFLRKAATARQKVAVLPPSLVMDPKTAAKNADKTEYAPEDFILQYTGLVNLATKEELLFPIDK